MKKTVIFKKIEQNVRIFTVYYFGCYFEIMFSFPFRHVFEIMCKLPISFSLHEGHFLFHAL